MKGELPKELKENYIINSNSIKSKLNEFKLVAKKDYFYELCFCICTPQSKAESAFVVQKKLQELDFFNRDINLVEILNNKTHYIRFHNQKSKRLIELKNKYSHILTILDSDIPAIKKREWLFENVNGLGMKESSHFLRNIGYRDLAILDRHILKHLVNCKLFENIPNISSKKRYLEVEKIFIDFSKRINIPIDELDLLFWSKESGLILK